MTAIGLPLSLLVLAACSANPSTPTAAGSSDSGSPIPDSASPSPDSAEDAGISGPVGHFGVELYGIELMQPAATFVTAGMLTAEKPVAIPLVTASREEECELQVPRIPFCDPPCANDSLCFAEGVCQPDPAQLPLGEVTVAGLRRLDSGPSSTLVEWTDGLIIVPTDELAYPPFVEGESIRWSVGAIGTIPAFSMDMPAISEMEVLSRALAPLPNAPLEVSWVPPSTTVPDDQRVIVTLDFTHHAGLNGIITCTAVDDGALTIPASLVTGLFALGTAGYPSLFATRSVRRTMAVGDAQMTFEVWSWKEIYVSIPGLTSCRTTDECPEGQRCLDNYTCGV